MVRLCMAVQAHGAQTYHLPSFYDADEIMQAALQAVGVTYHLLRGSAQHLAREYACLPIPSTQWAPLQVVGGQIGTDKM